MLEIPGATESWKWRSPHRFRFGSYLASLITAGSTDTTFTIRHNGVGIAGAFATIPAGDTVLGPVSVSGSPDFTANSDVLDVLVTSAGTGAVGLAVSVRPSDS